MCNRLVAAGRLVPATRPTGRLRSPRPVPIAAGEPTNQELLEVLRAARRVGDHVLAEARAVVGDLDLVPLDRAVQDVACDLGNPLLRTLGALHLASAVLLGEGLTAFITYHRRLADAASAAALVVSTPGQLPPPHER